MRTNDKPVDYAPLVEDIIELGTASVETQGGAQGGPEPSDQQNRMGISED
ncbi:benenodin family lasso peptide [Asticcacaulis sp. YBE204]|nr:benenodin family lasso peptide [Asticcacaulis sp. YBE204]ESQ78680.1 hypothetical protein AEYBE204_11895 [Asticcacaulis sp. YBE204]